MKKLLSLTINTQGFKTITKNGGSRKSKTYRGFKSQIKHNSRKEKMDADYLVRPENTKLNIHKTIDNLDIEISNMIEKMQEDYFNYYKRKQPKNTKPFINGLITFSETMQEDINKFGVKNMYQAIMGFLKEEYGNIISLDLHLDETTPHFHFQVLNYDFNKHKTHSAILESNLRDKNNPLRRNETQDRLVHFLKKHIDNFNYERGEIKSIKEYHSKKKAQEQHLTKQKEEIKKLEEQLLKGKAENYRLRESNKELISEKEELIGQVEILESQIQDIFKTYENDINELVSDLTSLNEEMEIKEFYKKVIRYLKQENTNRLKALIKKMNRKVSAIKKKKNNMS